MDEKEKQRLIKKWSHIDGPTIIDRNNENFKEKLAVILACSEEDIISNGDNNENK